MSNSIELAIYADELESRNAAAVAMLTTLEMGMDTNPDAFTVPFIQDFVQGVLHLLQDADAYRPDNEKVLN